MPQTTFLHPKLDSPEKWLPGIWSIFLFKNRLNFLNEKYLDQSERFFVSLNQPNIITYSNLYWPKWAKIVFEFNRQRIARENCTHRRVQTLLFVNHWEDRTSFSESLLIPIGARFFNSQVLHARSVNVRVHSTYSVKCRSALWHKRAKFKLKWVAKNG